MNEKQEEKCDYTTNISINMREVVKKMFPLRSDSILMSIGEIKQALQGKKRSDESCSLNALLDDLFCFYFNSGIYYAKKINPKIGFKKIEEHIKKDNNPPIEKNVIAG